ncbi:GMC family oxidoreductase N-terminal domain-containing protein [Azospirillum sp. SYSU D00513]|uniref:GMC family oxidoreductase n=1 Tax=Azospirillum sp. SYSU D00513 TaxID=2812561 RepID=UPI001A9757DB|nr:GMC family oxidoreductase N-terminal domain-containing protein [Azospirillum sp. SYSU D00513]
MTDNVFDFIVAGAGSAGCVLANRLSADGRYRVAVVEAGSRDNWIWFHIPVGYLFAIGNPRADWMFSTEAELGLNGRVLAYPRGRVIGGSSAINAMIYMRGQRGDYDGWRDMGLPGWGWDDVLPVFKKHEDHYLGASEFHGAGGEWRVDRPRTRWEILDSFIEAAAQSGIPRTDDFNRGDNEGCGYFQVNQKNGRRWSAARGFLRPALKRPNVTLITGATIDRVTFEGKRATGLVIRDEGGERTLTARREVILSAGAVGSPLVLERSGIGDADRLRRIGVEVVAHRPGVGENLQDHLQIRPVFKVSGVPTLNTEYRSLWKRMRMGIDYALFRRGPLTMAPSQLGAFTRSSPGYATPNLQFHVQPLSLDKFGEDMHPFNAFTVSVCNLRPASRGSVHCRSRTLDDKPVIAPNYLKAEEDRRVAVEAIRWARRVTAAPALARYSPEEYRPGAHLVEDAELAKVAGDISTTIFHPVGTARMGPAGDPLAVTDARLRVQGVEGLRVVDASVMPTITSGNTNSPTIMIAEKASAMILEDAR